MEVIADILGILYKNAIRRTYYNQYQACATVYERRSVYMLILNSILGILGTPGTLYLGLEILHRLFTTNATHLQQYQVISHSTNIAVPLPKFH